MIKIAVIVILLFLLPLGALTAHPHMSLDAEFELVKKDGAVTAINVTWYLDQFFSTSIIYDFDANLDGRFDAAENRLVYEQAFSNLKKYSYFCWFRVPGRPRFGAKRITNFKASIQNKTTLVYRFAVPLEGLGLGNDFWFAIFDQTYWCAVDYKKPVLRLDEAAEPLLDWEVVVDKTAPVYYNPLAPVDDLRTYSKWQKGLETTWMTELRFKPRAPGPAQGASE